MGCDPVLQRQPDLHQVLHSLPILANFPRPPFSTGLLRCTRHRGYLRNVGGRQRLLELRAGLQILGSHCFGVLSQFRSGLVLQRLYEHRHRRDIAGVADAAFVATAASASAEVRAHGCFRYWWTVRVFLTTNPVLSLWLTHCIESLSLVSCVSPRCVLSPRTVTLPVSSPLLSTWHHFPC